MSTLLVDQVKPLLQRLLTMAESHDERLARLEAAHSRLGNQLARLGEQLTRQGDQLLRMEETQVQALASLANGVAAAQAPSAVRPAAAIDPVANGRLGEQIARLNEQITRVREQFGRVAEQLGRIEQAVQEPVREEIARLVADQAQRLDRLQAALDGAVRALETQGETQGKILTLVEESRSSEPAPEEEDEILDAPDEDAPVAEEDVADAVDLAAIQNEMAEMRGQLALLLARFPEPPPRPAAAKAAAPAARPAIRPAAAAPAVAKPAPRGGR